MKHIATEDLSSRVATLVDDRVDQGVFRVKKDIYTDADIHEHEIKAIFERDWVFLCHESQIRSPGDYFTTHVGRHPVFVLRQDDGSLRAFLNICPHRGSVLLPLRQGRIKGSINCRFHGWAFGPTGDCEGITFERAGGYAGGAADKAHFALTPLARIDSYRGFVFGSLAPVRHDLNEFLGATRPFIDLFVDQSPQGIEVLRGSSTYVCHHNWKIQVENVPDGYHVPTVHRVFGTTVANRQERPGYEGLLRTETGRISGNVKNGCYDLARGHMLLWADRASPEAAPLYPSTAAIEAAHSKEKAHWMLRRGRNLMVFPNLVLNDLASTHLRTHRPLGPDRTEVTVWCIAPVGESREARYARLRKFEDFFLLTGMATSDDLVSLNIVHEGAKADARPWIDFQRGIGTMVPGPDEAARQLGVTPATSNTSWTHETPYHGLYRHWLNQMMSTHE
jgi:benzoate/toluate 1,2-dioxygenase subunit alpha